MYGPGLTNGTSAGCPTTFIVESRDETGKQRETSGDEFTIIIEHESGGQVNADVKYLGKNKRSSNHNTFDPTVKDLYPLLVKTDTLFSFFVLLYL